jgi:hypothetical protein
MITTLPAVKKERFFDGLTVKLTILKGLKVVSLQNVKDSFDEELDKFPTYIMRILLGDFNDKVDREDIFKQTTGNECLRAISNDNGARVENFATFKKLIVKSITFLHPKIPKFTWTPPDGKTHSQIDHILIDGRRQKLGRDWQ